MEVKSSCICPMWDELCLIACYLPSIGGQRLISNQKPFLVQKSPLKALLVHPKLEHAKNSDGLFVRKACNTALWVPSQFSSIPVIGQTVQTHLNWGTPGAAGLEWTLFHVSAGPWLLSTGFIIDSLFLWIKLCFNWWLPLPRCLQKKPGNLHSLCVLRYPCVWRPDGIIKCLPQPSQSSFETRSLPEPRAH